MAAIPPALRYRVLDVTARLGAESNADRLADLLAHARPWVAAEPELVELGLWMTDAGRPTGVRQQGCAWLALFPTEDAIDRLAAIALDADGAPALRDAAIRALTDRQLRDKHASTQWSASAIQLADDALFRLADAATTAGRIASPVLAHALRHVYSDGLSAVFARARSLWGAALECAATAPLARVLFVSIDDIQPVHRIRVLRLIAATLGD